MKKLIAHVKHLAGVVRWQQAWFAVVPVTIPLLLATLPSNPAVQPALAMPAVVVPQVRYEQLSAASRQLLPEHSVFLRVDDGDTLDSVLSAGGIDRAETATLTREFGKSVDLRRLRPGTVLRFHHDENGRVDTVEMKINGWGQVDAVRVADRFDVTPRPAIQTEIESAVSAKIESSLYAALASAGEGPQLAQEIVNVFQWDVDFFALQKGDSFSLVFRRRFSGSDPNGYSPITAARFVHNGQTYEAYRSEIDGRSGYYNAAGNPLRKEFLRAPLKFTRITSGFSKSRFHPILHIFRPHHGVDYGAPVGTPVMTTADGVVVAAERKGGEGNVVQVNHGGRVDTHYLHLSRFAKGIRPGVHVQQGEVIGYVGATGLATGPHLDYRVSDNGVWLDPLKLKSMTPDPLRGDTLRRFRESVAALAPRLQHAGDQVARLQPKPGALFR